MTEVLVADVAKLREQYEGEEFNPELVSTWHDSQAGLAISYNEETIFLEADHVKNDQEAINTLVSNLIFSEAQD